MLLGLGFQVGKVDVAVFIAIDNDDLQTAHLRRGRIGAVRRFRNQANVASAFALAGVIARNGHDAGVLALRAGVRLHANGVEAGNGLQAVFQASDHFQITLRLIEWGEGMYVGEFRPSDRNHLAGRVQLHGARTERNHRVIERQILVLQLFQVAQHLVFGVVRIKYWMHQDGVGT